VVADDIVCDAPAGRLEGADAYRDFLGPFVQILVRAELIAAFADEQTALIMYDTDTVPVTNAPGAECVTVTDGKITYSRFVFDRAPFIEARHRERSRTPVCKFLQTGVRSNRTKRGGAVALPARRRRHVRLWARRGLGC
jgi:hypothetical protein